MLTVIETQEFQQQAARVWTETQRNSFIDWIARNPLAGDVISGSDGARKVRWAASGRGKRGGARVVYFHLSSQGAVLLIAVYVKSEHESLPANQIIKVRKNEH
ncbi:putative transcriptional regulator [Gammaproteobacteria bacterium]